MQLALWAWWLLVVVGFFSLPSSKLVGYVLPALAPWCLLLSFALMRVDKAPRWTAAAAGLVCLSAVLLLASPGAARLFKLKLPLSSKDAAAVLAMQIAPGDRVVFVDEMFYDLPFYAGLKQPAIVASDRADPELAKRDNWRKELFDAARFDPARGRELLWPINRLNELTCHAGTASQATWFVLKPATQPRMAQVPTAVAMSYSVYPDRDALLMRAPARACP